MRQAVKGRRLAVLLFVVVAGLAAAGIAYAVVPDANGVIHGCYDTKTGALRVIDPDNGGACISKEAPLNWNQRGPTGPTGPQGPQGDQGPQGPAGPGVAALATVGPDGTVNAAFSRGVTQANVHHPSTGVYCIGGVSPQPLVAVASGKPSPVFTNNVLTGWNDTDTIVTTRVFVPAPDLQVAGCDAFPDTQVEVLTSSAGSAGTLVDRRFEISLEN